MHLDAAPEYNAAGVRIWTNPWDADTLIAAQAAIRLQHGADVLALLWDKVPYDHAAPIMIVLPQAALAAPLGLSTNCVSC
jgi:hypothetical protein